MVVSIGIVSNATVDLAKHLSFPTVIYSHVVSTIMELILVALLCIILSRDVYIYIYTYAQQKVHIRLWQTM